jgi:hypothetical protein
MAKVLKSFTFETRARGGFASKYPWQEWMDGRIHQLEAGKDFNGKAQTFRYLAVKQAKRLGKTLNFALIKKGEGKDAVVTAVVIQAVKAKPADPKPNAKTGKEAGGGEEANGGNGGDENGGGNGGGDSQASE